jgi:sporulation protein YlmC with PRC-barrel domain
MLRSARSLRDYHVQATDGNIGRVKDFLFDSQEWVIRYLVVDTREWRPGGMVLLIPEAAGPSSVEGQVLPVSVTRGQVHQSPAIDASQPVSRAHEAALFAHYGWPPYWGAGRGSPEPAGGEPNLRSMRHVEGYAIRALDGTGGRVEDFIVEDENWTVRDLVVDTRNWLHGKHVLIAPEWVVGIDGEDRTVSLELSQEEVKESPPYDPSQPVNRQYEVHLYDYYGRPKYWD